MNKTDQEIVITSDFGDPRTVPVGRGTSFSNSFCVGDIEIRSAASGNLIAMRDRLCPEDHLIIDSSGVHMEPEPGSILPEIIIFFSALAVLIVGVVIRTRRRRTRVSPGA